MTQSITVRCPNCGSFAHRQLRHASLSSTLSQSMGSKTIRTECPHCDYLMVVCMGKESICGVYAPAIAPRCNNSKLRN